MFALFKKNHENREIKKFLFDFWAEMDKNMELFYVMDQRQFITVGFFTDMWMRVRELEMIKRHESISVYAQAIEDFNRALKEYCRTVPNIASRGYRYS